MNTKIHNIDWDSAHFIGAGSFQAVWRISKRKVAKVGIQRSDRAFKALLNLSKMGLATRIYDYGYMPFDSLPTRIQIGYIQSLQVYGGEEPVKVLVTIAEYVKPLYNDVTQMARDKRRTEHEKNLKPVEDLIKSTTGEKITDLHLLNVGYRNGNYVVLDC